MTELPELADPERAYRTCLLDLASQHRATLFAAHTHTQPAQPTTVAPSRPNLRIRP